MGEKINKNTFIQVRVTDEDKELLKTKASELKMSLSQYIIYCCLVKK